MPTAARITGQSTWDTDTEFRDDCRAIHNALIASGGLIQTADTGQTDFTANTRAAPGYTVYRFNDAHQASYPLFLRIDWATSTATRPGLSWTLGTGSNGSGTITGVIRSSSQMWPVSAGGAGAATCDHFVTVGEGYVYILMNIYPGATGATCMMFIERSTDANGVVHPEEGLTTFTTVSGSGRLYAIHPTSFATLGPAAVGSPFMNGASWPFFDDLVGADISMMPLPYILRGKMRFHRACVLRPGRVSYAVPFNADYLGATKSFLSIETNWYHNDYSSGWWPVQHTSNGCAIAIPWV